MRVAPAFGVLCILAAAAPATAADYGGYPPPGFGGIRPPPPTYYVAAPPHYVQDLRTGRPGRWVVLQPTFLDRLLGERNGY